MTRLHRPARGSGHRRSRGHQSRCRRELVLERAMGALKCRDLAALAPDPPDRFSRTLAGPPRWRRADPRRQPLDAPDQRKPQYHCKERDEDSDGCIARQVQVHERDRQRTARPTLLLRVPEGVGLLDLRQMRKIPAGGGDGIDHSRVRPFQGSPVTSRLASPLANAHRELHDSQRDPDEDHDGAGERDQHQRLPMHVRIVLHPPRRTHQAQRVERHEGEVEAEEPAPEDRLAEALIELEAEGLRETSRCIPP